MNWARKYEREDCGSSGVATARLKREPNRTPFGLWISLSVRSPESFSAPPFSEALNLSLPRGGLSPTVSAPLLLCVAFLANEEKALPDLPAHSLLLTEVVCDTQAKIQLIEGRTESHFLQRNAPLSHNTGLYTVLTVLYNDRTITISYIHHTWQVHASCEGRTS